MMTGIFYNNGLIIYIFACYSELAKQIVVFKVKIREAKIFHNFLIIVLFVMEDIFSRTSPVLSSYCLDMPGNTDWLSSLFLCCVAIPGWAEGGAFFPPLALKFLVGLRWQRANKTDVWILMKELGIESCHSKALDPMWAPEWMIFKPLAWDWAPAPGAALAILPMGYFQCDLLLWGWDVHQEVGASQISAWFISSTRGPFLVASIRKQWKELRPPSCLAPVVPGAS